jgi:DNA sulfur modification protein DndE
MIDTVRVSEKARLQLITIKKRTKIKNWNVICRWAFLLSLKDEAMPAPENIIADSSVEMTWKTFAGNHTALYTSLLIYRLQKDKIDLTKENLIKYFKNHLHRGISFLTSSNFKDTKDFLKIIND